MAIDQAKGTTATANELTPSINETANGVTVGMKIETQNGKTIQPDQVQQPNSPPFKRPPPRPPAVPLKVIIIGAGIGGFSAAASLRQAGHDVKLLEQSSFSNETGAAIHVGPNASRLLGKLGYDAKRLRGTLCRGFAIFDSTGKRLSTVDNDQILQKYNSPHYLAHRIDLHNELKHLTMDADMPGKPAELHLQSKVVSVDSVTGTVTLANGQVHDADLIVAADGIHSSIRELLFDPVKPKPTGTAAYRFIIDESEIINDPECLPIKHADGICRIIMSKDKRVVVYPCRDSTLLNFVCIHQSEQKGETAEGWNSASSAEDVAETYKDFSHPIVKMLKKAQNVKCWQLLQRDELPSWIQGRVCLIGDAAHPMLPHHGQGGGQAMEDGAALGMLFTLGTTPKQVVEVLRLYEQVRHSRASKIQWLSATQYAGGQTIDAAVVQKYIYEHDVTEYAKQTRSSELIL